MHEKYCAHWLSFAPLILLSALSLSTVTGCSLSASLIGGSGERELSATYTLEQQEYAMEASVEVEDGIVTAFTLAPGATLPRERAHQMAFAANVRKLIIGKKVEEITLPDTVGEGEDAERLTKIFREQILSELQR